MIMKRVTKRERLQLWTYLNRDDPSVFVAQESQKTGNNFFCPKWRNSNKNIPFRFQVVTVFKKWADSGLFLFISVFSTLHYILIN